MYYNILYNTLYIIIIHNILLYNHKQCKITYKLYKIIEL